MSDFKQIRRRRGKKEEKQKDEEEEKEEETTSNTYQIKRQCNYDINGNNTVAKNHTTMMTKQ